MFLATALLYPCVLAVLCTGAGLLADRLSGSWLPAQLLIVIGAATLIAVSQLSTYISAIAPATPYLIVAVALAGYALAWGRARSIAARLLERPWLLALPVVAYLIALAPVLLAGRASFSSFMALSDSAVHLIGADYLIRHGHNWSHLDQHNSYGRFILEYYSTSYPSGADTLFGASGVLVRLPLIWTFQPFNAFMLASATGPAWLLARGMRLNGLWAALAALTAVVPALVYAYELLGSVKEVVALPMVLGLGCLVVSHRRWLRGPPNRVLPFALLLAGGVSALGIAFGAWALAAVLVLAGVLLRQLLAGEIATRRIAPIVAVGVGVLVLAALPTWVHFSESLHVAQAIATTEKSGNLHTPLRAIQVLGVWLGGSYKLEPAGLALTVTRVLVALTLIAVVLGAYQVLRTRSYALAGWLAMMGLTWLAVSHFVTTWASAKTLVLTSSAVVLMAWGGVAALKALPVRSLASCGAALLALALVGGVLVSDAMQYHVSNLAPTARYEELAKLNSRFAGQGPTLFTDFDEYSMYELRNLDVAGPDFVYPPLTGVADAAKGYGDPVDLDAIAPNALRGYPLIITRRDPAASRPPAAYRLVWQGDYYQVWRRTPGAPTALAHVALSGKPAAQCAAIQRIASSAPAGAQLTAAVAPTIVRIRLARSTHPAHWGHERKGLVMGSAGTLTASFQLPFAGRWEVWVQGQIMPTVRLDLDGRQLAAIGGQLSGNSLVPDTVPAIPVTLTAGTHEVSIVRPASNLAPGDGGAAVLDAIFLTPTRAARQETLTSVAASRWRSLCGRVYQWVEVSRG
jgi:hypothetical protein